MKFVCLGYLDERSWNALSERERTGLLDACFAYDDELRKGGHFAGGEALQNARNAVTLRYRNGKVSKTDGPFAETKEMLGGILFPRGRGLGPRGSHHVEPPRRQGRPLRDPAGRGHDRDHSPKRGAAAFGGAVELSARLTPRRRPSVAA